MLRATRAAAGAAPWSCTTARAWKRPKQKTTRHHIVVFLSEFASLPYDSCSAMVKCIRAQVSSHGRFRSTRGVITTPMPKKSGYVQVAILKKRFEIHRLIAVAFGLTRTENQNTVDHIDGDPTNNRLDNLRWASQSEQINYSYATNAARRSSASRLSKPVRGRKCGDEVWTPYASVREAARAIQLNSGHVSLCCAKRQQQTSGYEFEFDVPTEAAVLPGEEWRIVAGTGAQVSSHGRFRSTKGVITTPMPKKSGYVQVAILKKNYYIHRLIAVAFGLTRAEGQSTVDHIDGDPTNNRLDNLRWASSSEQIKYSYATNAARVSSAPRRSKPVRGRKCGDVTWTPYASVSEAARALQLNPGHVSLCCAKKRRQTGGYEFEFDVPTEVAVLPGEEWRDVTWC